MGVACVLGVAVVTNMHAGSNVGKARGDYNEKDDHCMFPFTYKKQVYNACTMVDNDGPWCGTGMHGKDLVWQMCPTPAPTPACPLPEPCPVVDCPDCPVPEPCPVVECASPPPCPKAVCPPALC